MSVAVLAVGAKAIAGSDSPSTASAAGAPVVPSQAAGETGDRRAMPPGMGADVTGASLSRLTSVVTAKYPGTVERAMKLPDGSYVVHVIRPDGSEVDVLVGSDLRITGSERGRLGGRGTPPSAGGSSSRQ